MKTIMYCNRELREKIFVSAILVFLIIFGGQFAHAGVSKDIKVQWKANPSHENIIGYKLYYGNKSRYDSKGRLKKGFKYDYCVDFTELMRCSGSNYSKCVDLGSAQVNCSNLYGDNPKCILKKLSGNNYFALTAYNAQEESSFTYELKSGSKLNGLAQTAILGLLIKD